MRLSLPAVVPSSRRRGPSFVLAAVAVSVVSLWAWPTLAQDAGSATARQVMDEALEREAAQAVPPARLPDAARDAMDEEALRLLDGVKKRGLSRAAEALDHAAEAADEGQARARAAQQAAEEKLKKAGQAAATRSRADAAKKAKPKPPRP